jgi:hypothetical protein
MKDNRSLLACGFTFITEAFKVLPLNDAPAFYRPSSRWWRQKRLVLTLESPLVRRHIDAPLQQLIPCVNSSHMCPTANVLWEWDFRFSLRRVWRLLTVFWDVAPCSLSHRLDDGDSKHLWNVGKLLPDYTVQHPRRQPRSYSWNIKCRMWANTNKKTDVSYISNWIYCLCVLCTKCISKFEIPCMRLH